MNLPHASSNLVLHERMAMHEAAYPSRAQSTRELNRQEHKRSLRAQVDHINPRLLSAIDITDVLNKLFAPVFDSTRGIDLVPHNRRTQQRRDHQHVQQFERQRRQSGMREAKAIHWLHRLRAQFAAAA